MLWQLADEAELVAEGLSQHRPLQHRVGDPVPGRSLRDVLLAIQCRGDRGLLRDHDAKFTGRFEEVRTTAGVPANAMTEFALSRPHSLSECAGRPG